MQFTPEVIAALQTLKNAAENDFERHRISVLERDLTEPPVVEVVDDKHQKFDGVVYRKKSDTHYGNGLQIHRVVYAYYFGEIPDDYIIHHIDANPANNDISNLQLLSKVEHGKLHGFSQQVQKFVCVYCGKEFYAVKNANSKNGNKFCSSKCCQHFHNRAPLEVKHCQYCGKAFETSHIRTKKYCSESCRRQSGYQRHEEVRICSFCGKSFKVDRYRKTRYCSRDCYVNARYHNQPSSLASSDSDS